MNETARILCAIPEKASISIKALLDRLEENRPPWTAIRSALMTFEAQELLTIRHNKGMITAVQLTELGAERAREAQEGAKR
jgi:DNA-binding GntR family transcriptional regulator